MFNLLKKSPLTICEIIFSLVLGIFLSFFTGPVLALSSSLLFLLLFILIYKKQISRTTDFVKADFLNSAIVSFLADLTVNYFIKSIYVQNNFFIILSILLFFPLLFIPFLLSYRSIRLKSDVKKDKLIYLWLASGGFIFIFVFFIELPSELYINNYKEFPFSYFDLLYCQLFYIFIFIVLLVIISLLPKKAIKIFNVFLTIIIVNMYIQIMFFNKYIGEFVGAKFKWTQHPVYSTVGGLVLILISSAVILSVYRFKKEKYVFWIPVIIFALLSTSYIYTLIKADSDSFARRQYYFDGTEQFTIGKDKNVVILLADAVDNCLIKELIESDPELFDEFNDFTIYTDTCSVYDMTPFSTAQMFFGYTQKNGTDRSKPFLKRFADNDYRILLFNYVIFQEIPETPDEYISNYVIVNDNSEKVTIDYKFIRRNILKITLFQTLPCFFKSNEKINFNFDRSVFYGQRNGKSITEDNLLFGQNSHLEYNPYSDNCFIYQHIIGAHDQSDDYTIAARDSLNAFNTYINQMKELNVYDNSLIIITADHGLHDDVEGIPYPSASTPMLLIKKPNEHHESYIVSDKSVYFKDFQATVIKYSGLSQDGDTEIFGKSIDEIEEGKPRTRVWFDTRFNSDKEIRKYTYTGKTEELERVVKEGIYTKVNSYEIDLSEYE